MRITKANIGNIPLDEFVTAVAGIYKTQDEKRLIWDVWLHAVNHAAAIGEEARKYKPGKKLLEDIADFSMWLFTFVGKIRGTFGSVAGRQGIEESTIRIKVTLSDIVWNKYPRVCPVCFGRRINDGEATDIQLIRPCDCLLYPVETRDPKQVKDYINKLRQYAKDHIDDKPKSVNEWQQLFQNIYEANLRHLSLTDIAFHLLEEVGEVSNAMLRMYTYDREEFAAGEPEWRQKGLENEIADVSSWLFTLVNHLESMPKIAREFQEFLWGETVLRETPITLSSIIWKRYGSDSLDSLYCPHKCKKSVCKCPVWLVRDKKSLVKIRDNFAPSSSKL